MNVVNIKEIAPGRRQFTIDVGHLTNEQINEVIEEWKTKFNATAITNRNTFNKNEAISDLNQYVKDAIRTESRLENLVIDRITLAELFSLYVHITEVLDAYKKAIFYGKTTKLMAEFVDRMDVIAGTASRLQETFEDENKYKLTQNKEHVKNVDPRVFHGILGVATESGELVEILMNLLDDPTTKLDPTHVQEELGDGMALGWYPAILHDALGLNPKDTLDKNIAKLKIRFPDKYTDDAAENRNLEAERKVLES